MGFTQHDVERRVAQQFPITQPDEGRPYEIVFSESAMREDGTSFMDHDVHRRLVANGIERLKGEWFRCTVDDVRNAWLEVRDRRDYGSRRTESFPMRPEQRAAVKKTEAYFRSCEAPGSRNSPKFLWNAKMRFGKTFATYELARGHGHEPRGSCLPSSPPWRRHGRRTWSVTSTSTAGSSSLVTCGPTRSATPGRPIVCFGSFQDYLGVNRETGGIKAKNEWVHLEDWDLVVFDEYHFGAWRERAQDLFARSDDDHVDDADDAEAARSGNAIDETWLPIQSRFYLYLSGTPFRALSSGEFIEDQVFNWTYSDEQDAKERWVGADNPYETLPRMVLMTYRVPDAITRIARQGEFNEFDLNVFFSAEGRGASARFTYEEHVQKWLDLIRGSSTDTAVDDLKLGAERPPMPFSDTRLLSTLTHTLWFLPNVASCEAMANLLARRQNTFFHDYKVIVAAGNRGRHGRGRGLPRAPRHGRPAGNQDHHALVRQAHHRGDHQAVERGPHAAQPQEPGDVLPDRISRAESLDHAHGEGRDPDSQAGVLRL